MYSTGLIALTQVIAGSLGLAYFWRQGKITWLSLALGAFLNGCIAGDVLIYGTCMCIAR